MSMNDESNATLMSLDYVPGALDRTAPKVIYLQVDATGNSSDRDQPWTGEMDENVSWSANSIGGIEILYVRADLATSLPTRPVEAVDVTTDMVKVALSAYMRGDDMKGYVGYSQNMRMALEAVAPMFAARPRNYGSLSDLRTRFDELSKQVSLSWMVYADEFAAWRDAIDAYAYGFPVPHALIGILKVMRRFNECAEDGEDVNLSPEWFDALTTIGLLVRVQRSPARWEMTDAGRYLLDLPAPTVEKAVAVPAVGKGSEA